MKTSDSLDFMSMCKTLPTYSKRRNKRLKIETAINDELEELGKRIFEFGGKGKVILSISIGQDKKRNQLKLKAVIKSELPTDEVESEVWQGEDGAFYCDAPNQGKLDLVADISDRKKSG